MFEFSKSIIFSEAEFKNNAISLSSLMHAFEEIAVLHANELGIVYKNKVWVILKLKIDFVESLQVGKEYILRTYINDRGKFDCDRYFEILSDNKVYIKAIYNWCLIDIITRKFESLEIINYPVPVRQNKNFLKINKSEFVNLNNKFTFVVKKENLDENFHMNNKVYGKIIENLFQKSFKQVLINYKHEAKLNDDIILNNAIEKEQGLLMSKIKDNICFCSLVSFL